MMIFKVCNLLRMAAVVAAEDDSSLTAGDKAIARFQKQRMKELKGASAQAAAGSSSSQRVLCSVSR